MGRIRTKFIKRMTTKIVRDYPGKFTADFEKNKKTLGEISKIYSKVIRNKIAGSVGRTIKNKVEI